MAMAMHLDFSRVLPASRVKLDMYRRIVLTSVAESFNSDCAQRIADKSLHHEHPAGRAPNFSTKLWPPIIRLAQLFQQDNAFC